MQIEDDIDRIFLRKFVHEVTLTAILECGNQVASAFANLIFEGCHLLWRKMAVERLAILAVNGRVSLSRDDQPVFPNVLGPFAHAVLREIVRIAQRSEEHTSELQSLLRISLAVLGLKKTNNN